jgi:hypothetical protein
MSTIYTPPGISTPLVTQLFSVPTSSDLLFFLLCQNKDLREVQVSRKKLSGRKLDYDCKKRHGAEAEEIIEAERKFAESYQVSVSLPSHNN